MKNLDGVNAEVKNNNETTFEPRSLRTLADLKRELNIGDSLTLIEAPAWPNHRYLNVKRYVVKKQSNGIHLSPQKGAQKGSVLDFVNAKLTEYDGKEIRIYGAGHRRLTPEEQIVLDNRPSRRSENAELVENDIYTDGSTTYYMDLAYFKQKGMEYLHSSRGTKRIDYNTAPFSIIDEQIKGNLHLRYSIEKSQ